MKLLILILSISCALGYLLSPKNSLFSNFNLNMNDDKRKPAGEDIISKIFGRFLPTPEDIGLRRFDSNTLPENYPATKV